MGNALEALIKKWRDDPGATYQSWFLWEERLKNFRSIRRGIMQVVEEIDNGTFGVAYRGGHVTGTITGCRLLATACRPPARASCQS